MTTTLSFFRLIRPGFPGKTRLARWLLRKYLAASPGFVTDRFGFRYEVPDLREPIAFHLAVDGVYEAETLDFVLRHLPLNGVFVDVGANIGAFTVPAAHRVGAKGRVLAAEASPEVFCYLLRNLQANHIDGVVCTNCAVCATPGSVSFYPAPNQHFGMGSMGRQFDAKPLQVAGKTLDQILEEATIGRVDVLKVDVEGFEVSVFQGARTLLRRKDAPLIVFEFCDWAEARVPQGGPGDAQRLLLEEGFSIWRLSDFVRRATRLREPLRIGYDMLVASRP